MQQPNYAESLPLIGPEVMEIEGRLDSGTASFVSEDVLLCIHSGARQMVLDCSYLTYMTAAGLRMILELAREMKSFGGELAVCSLQPQAEAIFRACGIDTLLPVFDEQSEAIAAFSV